ncbi:Uncharacterized protein BP5553_04544 [Venustampulla echinocandica]|uniref:CHY-type domain-containing protein n=1 Tax=Venustampulla echinocandica TaxID=2656787 RepID=A0A370TNL4_9HELO|nr:Uncharacterized protein BP5553_04544 [Venustampulla echinocandica]RDL37111.1 Uncharacterized protein BP5553_04544 [Venustampulla echinocandica]
MSAREGLRQSSGSGPLSSNDGMAQDRQQAVATPIASRVVPKPVPRAQTEDPREFQIGQIRRRFNPKETRQSHGATLLKFNLSPSDPDFPFDLSALECSLSVPAAYPEAKPSLLVGNRDIPRGFAFNIESGFDGLVQEKPDGTLLELLKALDRNLELFLSAPKADTIKLVPNKDTRHLSAQSPRSIAPARGTGPAADARKTLIKDDKPIPISTKPVEVFTAQQKEEASKRRENEVRQLEARMGRLPLYKKSGDGIAYTLPIEPRRRTELPPTLQAMKTVQLFVPLLYPLQPCRVRLDGTGSKESTAVEKGFELKASQQKDTTLMGHVNFLAQNMHTLSKTTFLPETQPLVPIMAQQPQSQEENIPISAEKGKSVEAQQDAERSHIQYIIRPPEWTIINHDDHSGSDFGYDSYDSGDESSENEGGVVVEHEPGEASQQPVQNSERGTAISFPFVELYGIELLEVAILNISVKCERCKEVMDVKGLKNGAVKSESCKKCATPLSVGFRRDFVHAHAVRAGFLDLDGCIIVDMLPSTFIPTCAQCSTAYPAPGLISVRGETTTNVCRECHHKLTFKIPQTKFLRISSADRLPSAGPRRKKETLGLTPGTELPKRGRCRHYTKSYRWFRFSCCQKVYTCDKCHDEGEEHPNEWANRMVCGWCSREQNYRPEDCGFCHRTLIGKKGGGGFWEGGKGTRDKSKMSRKDPRKFRRRGAATKTKT